MTKLIVTKDQLNNKTLAELAEIYNETAANNSLKTINKFSDKETAIKRTWGLLEQYPQVKKEKTKVKTNFVGLPFEVEPKDFTVPLQKPKSIRMRCFMLLVRKDGATFDELREVFEHADKVRNKNFAEIRQRIRRMMRIFCNEYGYGFVTINDNSSLKIV